MARRCVASVAPVVVPASYAKYARATWITINTWAGKDAAALQRTNEVTEGIFMKFLLTMRVIYIFTEPLYCLIMIVIFIIYIIGRKPERPPVHLPLYLI